MMCVVATVLAATRAEARQRAVRRLDYAANPAMREIHALGQDARGFLWIGTTGGVARWDGVELRPWRPELVRGEVRRLVAAHDGAMYALAVPGGVYRLDGESVEALPPLPFAPLDRADDLALDEQGAPWVALDGALWRLGARGWEDVTPPALVGRGLEVLRIGPDGRRLVASDDAVWSFDAAGQVTTLASELPEPQVVDLLATRDGAVWIAGFFHVYRAQHGALEAVQATRAPAVHGRVIALAERGERVWVAIDRYLLAMDQHGDGTAVIGPADALPSGGTLLVDREGSLWLGTFHGLLQFPEADTEVWTQADGLPSAHARFVTRTDEGLWVTTWQGLGRIAPGAPRAETVHAVVGRERPCTDARGTLWLSDDDAIVARRGGRFGRYPAPPGGPPADCARAGDGTVWLVRDGRVYRTSFAGPPTEHPGPFALPMARRQRQFVLETRAGSLWIASEEAACVAPAVEVAGGGVPRWACSRPPGASSAAIAAIAETAGGEVWLALKGEGVFRRERDAWVKLASSEALPALALHRLEASPRGGMWVLGDGFAWRVSAAPGAQRWAVLERLGAGHGLPVGGGTDVLEDDDGGVWLANVAGVVHVPAAARAWRPVPPPVALVDARVEGERVPVDRPLAVPHGVRALELSFRALAYRDPSRVAYRVRLGDDEPWGPASGQGALRLVAPAPGAHVAEVVASLDGEAWSPVAARLAFRVARPWFLAWWAWLGGGLIAAALLYAAHRARVAVLLRLQRQRMVIARDLHDELGSGLGSIGILAALACDGRVDEARRAELCERIGGTASELGTALGDIVWALRRDAETLDALVAHVVARARALFPGEAPRLRVELPADVPPLPLSLVARRNLQLVVLEALHNAARHAGAGEVTLGLRVDGRRCRVWVADDGAGLGGRSPRAGGGLGLRSMRERAREAGVDLQVDSRAGAGTTVTITLVAGPLRRVAASALEGRPS